MSPTKTSDIAFAFDIDGVLLKGTKPIPRASEAIELLQALEIPFIFLTNGGGHTEAAHVNQLGKRLGLTLDARQFVQSHTPFQDLVPEYGGKTVLVLGGQGQQIRELAREYGFRNVVTSSDLVAADGSIHPFPEMTSAHHAQHGRVSNVLLAAKKTAPIAAILCWTSPRDWCLDLQVVMDLLLSKGGVLGTRSPKNGDPSLPNCGYLQDGQPRLFFSNPDFEWSTGHRLPRFAQGAFREALQGVWRAATGGDCGGGGGGGGGGAMLSYSIVGKPSETTFDYAERALRKYADWVTGDLRSVGTVYMIGDNPESDIVGANSYKSRFGIDWKSVLVETGVYVPGSVPKHRPTHTASNVEEAVIWALEGEGGC
ncbi:hypothetical protein M426DRAFT_51357 [Hypoxylon sp. CI-4A]|nr:hypothetical protein M426DRAFT_51357 [Hypoxylon sp. CI-4A]